MAIIDRGLPDGDRIELVGELREVSPGAAVLVMSATVEQAHPQEAYGGGGRRGTLDKIIAPQEAISAIRRVVAAG